MLHAEVSRRSLIQASLATAGALTIGGYASAEAAPTSLAAPKATKLVETTAKCLTAGLICETHCIKELAEGNKGMAACLSSVRDMLATCTALQSLASAESKSTSAMAKVCAQICADCAKACAQHANHMDVCRRCQDACLDCEKACREVA